MDIVQVSPYLLSNGGGSERFCHELSSKLAERGHDVTLLTSKIPGQDLRDVAYKVRECPCLGIAWGVNPATMVLHRLISTQADVVHAHSYVFFTSNQCAIARKLIRRPYVLHLHGGVDTEPGSRDALLATRFRLKRSLYDSTVGKWTVRSADLVASVSKRDAELAKTLWQLDPRRVSWVPNAVDPHDYDNLSKSEHCNIVFIGRLEPWKGVQLFFDIAKIVQRQREDVTFTIVGGGSLGDYVKSASKERIKFLGRLPHREIAGVLRDSTLLVIPSFIEGLPTVCLEALASGVPVVASNVGGISEVVMNGETGQLFPPGDARQCSDHILRLIEDEETRTRMGRNGRRLVENEYSWDTVTDKVERMYANLGKTMCEGN